MAKLLILTASLAGTASAQEFDTATLALLGTSPATLGAVVFGLTSTIKRNTSARYAAADPPRKDPPAAVWWALSAVLGVLGGLLLYFSDLGGSLPLFGVTGWPTSVFFGLTAGLVAVIGRDGAKTVLGWIGGAAPAVIVTPAADAPLGLLSAPSVPAAQDDPSFPAATQTDEWPALYPPDDAPLAPQLEVPR